MYLMNSKSTAYYVLTFTVHRLYGRLSFLRILQAPLRQQYCSFFSFFNILFLSGMVYSGKILVVLGSLL